MPDFIDELKRVADAIKATADAIAAVADLQDDLDRSATLEIRNTTGRKLLFVDAVHDHGGFTVPPGPAIEPGKSEVYGSGSSGFLTGTAGAARWNLEGTEIFYTITWSIPFIGNNGNNSGLEGPGSEHLVLFHSGANGNTNVPMKYMIGERAALGDKHRDWRMCEKCKCLFFAPGIERSDCAAGGRHEFNPATFNFELPHSTPGIAYQGDWRLCTRCTGLFFNGVPGKTGLCPAPVPPVHEAEESFFLQHTFNVNVPADPQHQADWRFCINCFGLYSESGGGRGCPANGDREHQRFPDTGRLPPSHPLSFLVDQRPFNYRLAHGVSPVPKDHQDGWVPCRKCGLLFFSPEAKESNCPIGGAHEIDVSSVVFHVATVRPGKEAGTFQDRWSKCRKCKSMFFDGFSRGRCSVRNPPDLREGHKAVGVVYHLPHEMPGPGQNQWRFCSKCFSLHFQPASGGAPCAAGGQHVAMALDFRLNHLE
jgi:hypothetical protein